jgi:hypothetical protein
MARTLCRSGESLPCGPLTGTCTTSESPDSFRRSQMQRNSPHAQALFHGFCIERTVGTSSGRPDLKELADE